MENEPIPSKPMSPRDMEILKHVRNIQSNVWITAHVPWQANIARYAMDESVNSLIKLLHSE